MHYKTIVLELLQQHPEIQNQLRSERMLLATMEFYAREVKARHEAWKDHLSRAMPDSDPSQVASEALEIALHQLKNILHSAFHSDEDESSSDEGEAALRRGRTPVV
jgi:aromatic ring hydroxylase